MNKHSDIISTIQNYKKLSFNGSKSGRIKDLSAYKAHHKVQDEITDSYIEFIQDLGKEDLNELSNRIFKDLKDNYQYKLKDVTYEQHQGNNRLITPDFTIYLSLEPEPQKSSNYITKIEVTEIPDLNSLERETFIEVFDNYVETINMPFSTKLAPDNIINLIEAYDDEDIINVSYDINDLSRCVVYINRLNCSIEFNEDGISISKLNSSSLNDIIDACLKLPELLSECAIRE